MQDKPYHLQLMGEMFNVANHPNITGVSTTAYNMSSNSATSSKTHLAQFPPAELLAPSTGQTQIECSVMTYVPRTNNAAGSGLFNQQSGFGSATNANSNFAYSVRQVMLTMRIEW